MGSEGGEEVGEEGKLRGHLPLLVLLERVEGMGCEEVGIHKGASYGERWRLWGRYGSGARRTGLTRVAGSRGDLEGDIKTCLGKKRVISCPLFVREALQRRFPPVLPAVVFLRRYLRCIFPSRRILVNSSGVSLKTCCRKPIQESKKVIIMEEDLLKKRGRGVVQQGVR
jgi:hypothetical protein